MIVFYFLIFVMPLSKHRFWGALAGDFTGIKYLGMVCLPYAIFYLARRRSVPPFFSTWQARLFFVLYFIATLSYMTKGRVVWNYSHWLTYSSFAVLFFIALALIDSLERVRWVVLSGIGSLGLASLYVLRDWQQGHNLYPGYRPGWVVGDPNYFTVNALLFMPVALLLLRQTRPRWQWLFCLGCFALTLTAVMFSASRGGFIGLVAASTYFLARSRQRIRNLILVCLSILVLGLPLEVSPVERLLHPDQSDDEAKQTRIALWSGGLKMITESPILGIGLDNFPFEVPKYVNPDDMPRYETLYRVAHNSYVEIAAELGVPALLIFMAMLFSSIGSLERVGRVAQASGDDFLRRVALGLQAGIVGGAVAIFFVSGEYQKLFWLALFLSMCLPPLVRQESSKASANQALDAEGAPTKAEPTFAAAGEPAGRVVGSFRERYGEHKAVSVRSHRDEGRW